MLGKLRESDDGIEWFVNVNVKNCELFGIAVMMENGHRPSLVVK